MILKLELLAQLQEVSGDRISGVGVRRVSTAGLWVVSRAGGAECRRRPCECACVRFCVGWGVGRGGRKVLFRLSTECRAECAAAKRPYSCGVCIVCILCCVL